MYHDLHRTILYCRVKIIKSYILSILKRVVSCDYQNSCSTQVHTIVKPLLYIFVLRQQQKIYTQVRQGSTQVHTIDKLLVYIHVLKQQKVYILQIHEKHILSPCSLLYILGLELQDTSNKSGYILNTYNL
jgi:hypothetical protein